ncbi:MAG: lipopolysaccharide heptosyltransferase II [Methylovulum sp.]|nr:MAG: lipopolysaccharide heptosyltransferase II [Methylovulum sp.]
MAKKILVVGPSWVGDMVMAQSLFLTLRHTAPDCLIDVLAPAWSFPLLDRMPEVSNAIAMPLTHGEFGLSARIQLGRQLRSEQYDQAIVLPNSWKSALAPFFAGIPMRTGFLGECRCGLLNDARQLDKSLLTMTVQRFVALALPKDARLPPAYPMPALIVEQAKQQAVIQKFGLTRSVAAPATGRLTAYTPALALCPGAEYGTAKRWPAGYYADVARQKLNQGWQVWLFGSDKDQAVAGQINQMAGGLCTDFTGRTTLAEAVDLLSLADTVVTNDSGLMHVAAALNKTIIALYGSSSPGFTPPLSTKAHILSLNLICSPCFKRECPLYPPEHEAHTHCLTGIRPERVLELIAP